MKKLIIVFVLFTFFGLAFSKQVDQNTAKNIGQAFLKSNTRLKSVKGSNDLQLVYTSNSLMLSSIPTKSTSTSAYFYVFNVTNSKGFVIVAGDDNASPILAYSDEVNFDPNNIPQNTAKWLENYKAQIRYIVENKIQSTEEIKNEWQNINTGKGLIKSTTSVSPLILTKWGQSPYYNDLCPYDIQNSDRTVTGCVATAMAQIMKFWNYPANGTGFHSYNHSTYGTLSANFGSTTYQWNSMPNIVSTTNNDVATLMYQCGISVDMDYNIASQGGSGTNTLNVASALKTYFGYPSSVQGIYRSAYTDTQWKNLLKTELDAGRPIQYAGTDPGGGHSFICDGYDINDFFHFNWGWSGEADAFYSVNMLNPETYKFNSNHRAIIGIQPPLVSQSFDIRLYNNVTPSATTIVYGQPFTITTNVANYGTNVFSGDYSAVVFDNSFTFIDFVEIKTDYSLTGGSAYSTDIVFSNTGLLSMLPGTYHIGIFCKPTGGNWVQVANNASYTNLVHLTVSYGNDIELNSSIIVTPTTSLTVGQAASVNLNILNDGATIFTGQYCVDLYNLDGTFAQTLNTINESSGLPSGYTYVSPFLTFNTSSVTVNPGTYLLAVMHKPTSGSWQLTGSTYYQNPIKVIVKEAPLQPDIYEPNNALGQSYSLPVSFSGNTTTVNSTGSNCHLGSDYDYYEVILPSGYDYTITPRIHDSYNSGNGNTYTLDGLFSYTTDGTNWSEAYDDIMPGNILVNNGGTINLIVAPYFSGETGSYLLDMNIFRSLITSVEKNAINKSILVYPNPANDFITIDLQKFDKKVNEIQLINIFGQLEMSINSQFSNQVLTMPINTLSNGTYFLRLKTNSGIITRKIIIKK